MNNDSYEIMQLLQNVNTRKNNNAVAAIAVRIAVMQQQIDTLKRGIYAAQRHTPGLFVANSFLNGAINSSDALEKSKVTISPEDVERFTLALTGPKEKAKTLCESKSRLSLVDILNVVSQDSVTFETMPTRQFKGDYEVVDLKADPHARVDFYSVYCRLPPENQAYWIADFKIEEVAKSFMDECVKINNSCKISNAANVRYSTTK